MTNKLFAVLLVVSVCAFDIPLKKKFVKECSEDKKCKETWTNVGSQL